MKILIPTGVFPPDIGGPASSVPMLASKWSSAGHKVEVVTYSDGAWGASDKALPYIVRRVPRKFPLPFRYLVYTGQLLRGIRKADVIFAQDGVASGFPAWIASRIIRRRFVVKIVGDFAWEHAVVQGEYHGTIEEFQKDKAEGKFGIMKRLQSFVVRRADAVIVPSHKMAEIVVGWGARKEQLSVVYNGIARPKESSAGTRHEDCILAVGRLAEYKRFDVLVKALPLILEKRPKAVLLIVGEGEEKVKLEKLAKSLGVARNVQFSGRLTRDEVLQAMRECGVYAHPSSYEGFSHQLLEAFVSRIPVVATRIGGIMELVQDKKNGLLADVGDIEATAQAILKMMNDTIFAKHAVAAAYRDVGKFTVEHQVSETETILNERRPLRMVIVGRDPQTIAVDTHAAERMEAYASRVSDMHVIVFARHERVHSVEVRGYTAEVVPNRGFLSLYFLWWRIFQSIRGHKSNLVMAQDPFELGLVACKAAFFARAECVVEDHGAFYASPAWRKENLLNRLRWFIGIFVVRFASGIRCVNAKGKEAYGRLSKKKPFVVVPVAMELPEKTAEAHKGPFTVIFAGRFVPQKNLPMLLSSFSALRQHVPDARLVLVGEGEESDDIVKEIEFLGLEDAIEIIPWTDELPVLFAHSDIAAIASGYEGYCRFAAEAMAVGLPVVMTEVGCAGELIRDGQEGFVVPIDDVVAFTEAMRKLAENPEMRAHMRENALKRAKSINTLNLTAESMVRFWKNAQKL